MNRIFRYTVALLAVLLLLTVLVTAPIAATEAGQGTTVGLAGQRLDGPSQMLYLYLGEQIEAIASGERANAYFVADEATIAAWGAKYVWTNMELGVAGLEDWHMQTALNSFWEQFDLPSVMDALMHDHPFEMFWYDKTVGLRHSSKSGMTGVNGVYDTVKIKDITFSFAVVPAYQSADFYTEDTPMLDVQRIAAAYATLENARRIVAQNAEKSDYEKLLAYRDAVCDLTSYNDEAVDPLYQGGYGDPWQAIYVFDGDPDTKVVCEGYAKAFQLLCDLSDFEGDVRCYTVTGVMQGGKGAGSHMWNVVHFGNSGYIVDVTNSDTGTVGEGGKLFLAGYSRRTSTGYSVRINATELVFNYDEEALALWGWENDSNSILLISSTAFEPTEIQATAAHDLIYTGAPLTVGVEDADILYACKGGESLTERYTWSYQWYQGSKKISAPIDAGEYRLVIKAVNKSNSWDSDQKQYTVVIERAVPTYTVPTDLCATYGDTLSSVILPEGFAWQDANSSVGAVGVQSFLAVFTPTDTKNYKSVELEIALTVERATPTYTVPTNLTASYGMMLGQIALPDGFTWQDAASTPVGELGEHRFLVTYTPSDTASYLSVVDIEVTVSVGRRDIVDATVTLGSFPVYNGEAQEQTVLSVLLGSLEATYTVSGCTATDIGVYTLTITGTGNFIGTTTAEWRITPDLSVLERCDKTSVKSSDRAAIEEICSVLEDKAAEWESVLAQCEALIEQIDSIASECRSVQSMADFFGEKEVDKDDKPQIENALARVEALLKTDNLTAQERAGVQTAKQTLQGCLDQIGSAEARMLIMIGAGVVGVIALIVTISLIVKSKRKAR